MGVYNDWFMPAIYASGSVEHCLDQVIQQEEARLLFLKALKSSLCDGHSIDAITLLKSEASTLKKTLDVRLGVMDSSRFPAWFRSSTNTEWGPFPGHVIKDAVFNEFPRDRARKVRNEILSSWDSGAEKISSMSGGECLWSRLLRLNCRWHKICNLGTPYADLSLSELPEGLPDDFSSPALIGFLANVRGTVDEVRELLNDCFFDLFSISEDFLKAYYRKKTTGQSYSYQKSATYVSQELKSSLSFMDFTDVPSDMKLIRSRYLELARSYHPDVCGGDESLFKDLTFHYNNIIQSLPKRSI